MNRKEFLSLCSLLAIVPACRYDKGDTVVRQVLLEADLNSELLSIGAYKINATVGLFVRRKTAGNTPRDFDCYWMICTNAKCFVQYREQQEQFTCPCHGSVFNRHGQPIQGPAAAALEKITVDISRSQLRVYG